MIVLAMTPAPSAGVTTLLRAWRNGDESAFDKLVPIVYDELRRIARRHMARERHAQTLQTTALINEAYLRLVDIKRIEWQDRAHFLAMAARTMRRVLIEAARARQKQKRGGGIEHLTLDEASIVAPDRSPNVLALNDALDALSAVSPRKAQVIELRFFGGLTNMEAAEVLHVSEDTVRRDWRLAKAWLFRELKKQP
jgi:RNA polymerase sigma factor (TIGR02999 family)